MACLQLTCSMHIAVGAENVRTGKTMAEKMLKIMEERLKEKAGVTEKLNSKNHALKVRDKSAMQNHTHPCKAAQASADQFGGLQG